jgi:hypothetical protein
MYGKRTGSSNGNNKAFNASQIGVRISILSENNKT